jgi:hypothetical protein
MPGKIGYASVQNTFGTVIYQQQNLCAVSLHQIVSTVGLYLL